MYKNASQHSLGVTLVPERRRHLAGSELAHERHGRALVDVERVRVDVLCSAGAIVQ